MENKLQCSASGVLSTARSRHFNLHPSHLSRRSLRFHPQKPSRASLFSRSTSELLAPGILLEPRPAAPWLSEIDYPKNITRSRGGAASPPVTSHINGGRARPRARRRLSLPLQMLWRKPVSAVRSQRAQKPLWQPDHGAPRKLHPCNTNNPSAAAALRWRPLIPAPPCELQHSNTHTASGNGCNPPLGFYNQRNEIFKGFASRCIFPKYCGAHLPGGDSDDSIKHMNEGNCHVDVAEH